MIMRVALLMGLLVLGVAGLTLWRTEVREPDEERVVAAGPLLPGPLLPVPPVPPRVAEGEDYARCLDLLETDPAAAAELAAAWAAGGEGAAHCLALSRIALGEAAEGAALLEALAGRSNASAAGRAMLWGQAGQAWMMADDGARAYAAATRAVGLLGDDVDLLIDRAGIAAQIERYEDALADLDQVLARDPGRADAMVLRATALRLLDRVDMAEAEVARALGLDPDLPEGLLERGILRQRHGDADGARADWERVIELDPDGATADLAEQNLALLDAGPGK